MYEIVFEQLEQSNKYKDIIDKVIKKCFEIEKIENSKLCITIILTIPKKIKEINKKYRNIDKETDVLSFPMFEADELAKYIEKKDFKNEEILGDIVISIERVMEQAREYGHSFEREFSYMLVHGFYHLMGYDHMSEGDKKIMREKEENIMQIINCKR